MNKKQKILEIKTNKLVDSLFVWSFKTHFKGNWIEFADFREYNYWDDIKNIDWLMSEKEWKTLLRLYEEERELNIYFIIDSDENFNLSYPPNEVPLEGNTEENMLNSEEKSKYDIIEELIYLIWFSSIKWWDKLWLFIYNSLKKDFLHARKWKSNLINVINKTKEFITNKSEKAIFEKRKKKIKENSFLEVLKGYIWGNKKSDDLLEENKKPNNLSTFNALKIKQSLVFLLTSKTEIDDSGLKVLALKNDLIVCNIFHSFENTLYWEWIKWFNNPDWLWISWLW